MQTKLLFAAGVFALAMSNAHAATWVMVDGGNQTRLDQSVNLTLGASEGAFSHSANPIPGTLVDASGFSAYGMSSSTFALLDNADSFSADFAHEASGSPDASLDGLGARLKLNTLIALNSVTAAGSMLTGHIAFATFASQDFRLAPGLGEVAGDLARVNFASSFDRYDDAGLTGADLYDFAFNVDVCDADGIACSSYIGETLVANDVIGISTSFDVAMGSVLRVSGSVGLKSAEDLFLAAGNTNALIYGGQTLDLTITPVPEPETWAMLLMGMGLIGLRVRSKGGKSFTYNKIGA